VLDFNLTTIGPHHVTQGHFMFFNVLGTVTAGTDENATPSVTGLPSGATATWPNMEKFCCKTFIWAITGLQPVRVDTTAATAVGTYPLTVTYTSKSGVIRTVQHSLVVDPVPGPLPVAPFPADVALWGLAQWEAHMLTYGKTHCTTPAGGPAWEGAPWYYDGTRVYFQIADYTKDPKWNACANALDVLYQQYCMRAGGIPAWHIFPQGLAMGFLRNGTAADKTALLDLLTNNLPNFQNVALVIGWLSSREISYALETHLAAESIGNPRHPNFQNCVEVLLGHFDQWFVSKTAGYVQPFMVALGCEALIGYWDSTKDPRVPPLIQLAADSLWSKSWDAASNSFFYYEDGKPPVPSPDLNLLIVPIYGWVFQHTGQQAYRIKGDSIFNEGVSGAYLTGGKQFSQNYRWSGKYVEWRKAPAPSAPTGKVTITANGQTISLNPPVDIKIQVN
jgi:hypothetical protein